MSIIWGDFFDDYSVKTVTATDKDKRAYLPTADQCRVIQKAGITPSNTLPTRDFRITVLNDELLNIVASFYRSQRQSDPSRLPEPRMGREFISSWLKAGDVVLLGVLAKELFAVKLNGFAAVEGVAARIANRAKPQTIVNRAALAKGRPKTRVVTHEDFVRDPYVVKAALIRAGNLCEMPSCKTVLFKRDNGNDYVEVHHVVPLSEGGDDCMANVAALCPQCHREQHFGKERSIKRAILKAHIDKHSA